MELQLTWNSRQTAPKPYWTPVLTGTMKLASYPWHLCCCFHFQCWNVRPGSTASVSEHSSGTTPWTTRSWRDCASPTVWAISLLLCFLPHFLVLSNVFTCFASGTCRYISLQSWYEAVESCGWIPWQPGFLFLEVSRICCASNAGLALKAAFQ